MSQEIFHIVVLLNSIYMVCQNLAHLKKQTNWITLALEHEPILSVWYAKE